MASIEAGKRAAAEAAVAGHVRAGMRVGVGSGSTVVHAVALMGGLPFAASLRCVCTSFQARQLCAQAGLAVAELDTCPELDVVIDGADEGGWVFRESRRRKERGKQQEGSLTRVSLQWIRIATSSREAAAVSCRKRSSPRAPSS